MNQGDILQAIKKGLEKRIESIQNQMRQLETRIGRNSRSSIHLKDSITLTLIGDTIVFKANNYGKFQDEGTYQSKSPTRESLIVWPKYTTRGGHRRNSRGITPLHFTKPLEQLNKENIINDVKPFVKEAVKEQIKNELKKL